MTVKLKMKSISDALQRKRTTHIQGVILSQSKAADLCGLKKNTYWEIETGKTKNLDAVTFIKICQWLGKDMDSFFIKSKK